MKQEEVLTLVQRERDYQDVKWPNHYHTPGEWIVFIDDYLTEAKHVLSRNSDELAESAVMGIIRKITAMGVCAMEQNDTPPRTF